MCNFDWKSLFGAANEGCSDPCLSIKARKECIFMKQRSHKLRVQAIEALKGNFELRQMTYGF